MICLAVVSSTIMYICSLCGCLQVGNTQITFFSHDC